jgi:hypothetical protein
VRESRRNVLPRIGKEVDFTLADPKHFAQGARVLRGLVVGDSP